MAMRNPQLSRLVKTISVPKQCTRHFHRTVAPPTVPSPTPFVPDVQTFLTLIGREMSKHASKLSSWEKLFTLNSNELRDLGIEPARQRRYLLRKRERFRNGLYGPGGDLEEVVNGVAQLRVVEVPDPSRSLDATDPSKSYMTSSVSLSPGMRKVIVNLAPDATRYKHDPAKSLKQFAHMSIYQGSMVRGPFLEPVKGTNGSAATIKVQEGMWEDKRGHKVAGGERQRREFLAKKRIEEKKARV